MVGQWAIQPGHGKKNVSCSHGSRWMWWPGETGKGEWMNVVLSSQCNCATPPRPDNVPDKPIEERIIEFDSSEYHKMEDYFKRTR